MQCSLRNEPWPRATFLVCLLACWLFLACLQACFPACALAGCGWLACLFCPYAFSALTVRWRLLQFLPLWSHCSLCWVVLNRHPFDHEMLPGTVLLSCPSQSPRDFIRRLLRIYFSLAPPPHHFPVLPRSRPPSPMALEYARKWRATANVRKCAVVVCNEDKVNSTSFKWKWGEDDLRS